LLQQSHMACTQMHKHSQNAHCRLRVGQHERLIFLFNAGEIAPLTPFTACRPLHPFKR